VPPEPPGPGLPVSAPPEASPSVVVVSVPDPVSLDVPDVPEVLGVVDVVRATEADVELSAAATG